ncbi:hypothetical protein E4U59_005870 [Claviceps monticola]|nr:hypothetical protein E4U59_005870 [Claviceps monticola]
MVLQLYADPITIYCHKVLAALDHIGADYKMIYVDYLAQQQKLPGYLRINPNGTIPAAVDDSDDLIITESNAIMQYAADISGDKGAEVYPKDLKQRALINSWLFWEASGWARSNYVYLVQNVLKPRRAEPPDEAVLAREQRRWLALANVLNSQLEKTKYMIGDTVTIADFAVMAPMHIHTLQKLPLDGLPHLKRWIADMERGVQQVRLVEY